MDPILYKAAHGGHGNLGRQEVIANNLANANTTGFKSDLYQAQTMYAQGTDGSTLGDSFAVRTPNGVDFTAGSFVTTGRNLDVALEGNGWFAVRDSSGKESYTKAGNFTLDANGRLTTPSGKQVMGNGGPIALPPAQSITIANDGTISIVPLGGEAKSATMVDRLKMVSLNKNDIVKNNEGLFQLRKGGVAPIDNSLKLRSGVLEGSNVNVIDQMVAMINSGRDFESHMDLLSTIGDNAQKLAQLIHE